MILHIDTKDQKIVRVSLKEGGKIIKSLSEENEYGSQVLLPLILSLLKTVNCKLKTLKGIEVETGPGSFTGLRVGVSVANALGFSLGVPVNGKKIETELVY
ncbi:tRNA (adenosine(37)-N6)-threonylcarbamoyltransferase complex dimerization subunit type 1 TsaB [Candidatus Daviesbacteria bacterium RIFCSPLOWO2_02_FULL_36_7]|uniref:tRNA (Adenosine(37)-N6)-threonylcarbamoyltransferase complex dimerization subunit type 1 TsaB n=1 Tax=Candidatus Daviesbacteria bacterium RIFCSPLOWO2_02_FULL_36_7 TaxID=1797792 RepID=A0A1F5MIB6_9BACT|nr:MAG: tRNA (adenosine(37)-N6)-threonylcarbamoyltransferase complex dimerization subunit type 1 TsaB [Candidatus Daviesbacteria bacterium RIFCSPLOWO2_02_FULL_36_7]